MVDASGSDWMGRYIIKREYSEGSHHVFGLALPQLGPISVSADDLQPPQGRNAVDAALSAHVGYNADAPHAGTPEYSSNQAQAHTPSSLRQHCSLVLGHVKAVISKLLHPSSLFRTTQSSTASAPGSIPEAELQPLGGPDLGSTISTCINPDPAAHEATEVLDHSGGDIAAMNDSWVYGGLQVPAELNSLLAETADRLMHYSCGEGWLVQPRIANMSGLEYRVYLLGGASAVSAFVLGFSSCSSTHACRSWHKTALVIRYAACNAELQRNSAQHSDIPIVFCCCLLTTYRLAGQPIAGASSCSCHRSAFTAIDRMMHAVDFA